MFILYPQSNVTNEMGYAELSCTATSIVPVTFQWEKLIGNTWGLLSSNSNLNVESTILSGNNYTSTIRNTFILHNDEGSYRCIANNSAGTSVSDDATIIVYGEL